MEPARLEEFGVDINAFGPGTDPSTLPPEAQAFIEEPMADPPRFALGMVREFMVTSADSTPGPPPVTATAEPTQDAG